MKTTENYGFNLFEGQDKLSMSKINENTQAIENQFLAGLKLASGTYTGTGTTAHSLTFEFVPKLVFITLPEQSKTIYNPGYDPYTKTFKNRYGFWVFGGDRMFLPGISFASADGAIHPDIVYAKTTLDGTTLSLTGFDQTTTVAYEAGEIALNAEGVEYHYIAIGQAAEEGEG